MTKGELRRCIKKETRALVKENRWNLVLGSILVGAVQETVVLPGPMAIGLANYSLKAVRGEECNTGDLFHGFSKNFGRNIGLFILQVVYIFLWTLLFYIPGIIKLFSYAMTFYISRDNPDLTVKEAITKSRQMMNGHKWELFVFNLSFIGWILLSCLTLGLLLIFFVGPWMSLAQAKFYDSIKE